MSAPDFFSRSRLLATSADALRGAVVAEAAAPLRLATRAKQRPHAVAPLVTDASELHDTAQVACAADVRVLSFGQRGGGWRRAQRDSGGAARLGTTR